MRKKKDMKWLRYQMRGLCYRSLAYCCGTEKPCPYRDKVLKKLGISYEKFRRLKNLFDKILLEVVTFEKTGKKTRRK